MSDRELIPPPDLLARLAARYTAIRLDVVLRYGLNESTFEDFNAHIIDLLEALTEEERMRFWRLVGPSPEAQPDALSYDCNLEPLRENRHG